MVDYGNGSYRIEQVCSIDTDEKFKFFIRIEKTAEQIQFLEYYKRSHRPSGIAHYVHYNNSLEVLCATLPWRKSLKNFSTKNRSLWCDIDPKEVDKEKFYGSSVSTVKHYGAMPRTLEILNLTHIMSNPSPVFITSSGIANFDEKDLHYQEIKLDNKNLPLCNSQSDGLVKNNKIVPESQHFEKYKNDREYNKIFANKTILLLDGDSTTRILSTNLRSRLHDMCHLMDNSRNLLEKRGTDFYPSYQYCTRKEGWTQPSSLTCTSTNTTLMMSAHGGPPLSNANCNLKLSGGFLVNSLEYLIPKDGQNTHIVFGPAYHFNSENFNVYAKEWYDILEESKKLKLTKPKIKFYAKVPHWWAQTHISTRLMTPYVNMRMGQIIEKMLKDTDFQLWKPWNQVVARNKLGYDDVHPRDLELELYADLLVDKILLNS